MQAKPLFRLSIAAMAFVAFASAAPAQAQDSTRADMRSAVLAARARGELVPAGEAVQPFARVTAHPDVCQSLIDALIVEGAPGEAVLSETSYFRPPTVTYASGANAAIVEVDADMMGFLHTFIIENLYDQVKPFVRAKELGIFHTIYVLLTLIYGGCMMQSIRPQSAA